ncbi:unnamed protein product [Paramecium octaurelia]|uniref:Uncharacterized protein n=1 Tax=Paramecium octaurelia TaxID=43137 RepID=A0A8S1YQU4_PAROT|nr:unnamed protein product [Paramecium octaurelia]
MQRSIMFRSNLHYGIRMLLQIEFMHIRWSQVSCQRSLQQLHNLRACSSTEGFCFWGATDASGSCRTKICSDIPDCKTTQACQVVANYASNEPLVLINKTACRSKGTNGICVWTETTAGGTTKGKCSLITSCASAAGDTNACTQANDICQMDSKTKLCADHTCLTYATQIQSCKYFCTLDQNKYNSCSTVNGACTATKADILKEGDCYTLTVYLYSRNPANPKCTQYGTIVVQPNNLAIRIQALLTKPIQILVIFLNLPQLQSDYSCPLDFDY